MVCGCHVTKVSSTSLGKKRKNARKQKIDWLNEKVRTNDGA